MNHQQSPSLKLGLMALWGVTVCIFPTEEPEYSKIFVVKSFIEKHIPHICSSLATTPWHRHRLTMGHRQDPEHEASLEKPPEAR